MQNWESTVKEFYDSVVASTIMKRKMSAKVETRRERVAGIRKRGIHHAEKQLYFIPKDSSKSRDGVSRAD